MICVITNKYFSPCVQAVDVRGGGVVDLDRLLDSIEATSGGTGECAGGREVEVHLPLHLFHSLAQKVELLDRVLGGATPHDDSESLFCSAIHKLVFCSQFVDNKRLCH